jgi:acyl carrier protein
MDDQAIMTLVTNALDSVAPGRSEKLHAKGLQLTIRELGIDSVATMEMVGAIEEKIGVTFPDEDLAGLNSMQDLANLIRRATVA